MNSHLAQTAPATHQAVQQMLPWLLAGTLDSAELAMVELHLQSCAQCQADLAWQRKLRVAAALPPDDAFDADRAFAQLLPRLGPQASSSRVGVLDRWRKAAAANGAWLKWTAAFQLAAIGVLSLMLVRPGHDADYRAMGAAARADGNAVVMFRPDTTEREMRRILQASGARVVDGPTVTDAYVLALPASQLPAALARMRAERAVTLAQPLAAKAPP
jgi:hypothetical protein